MATDQSFMEYVVDQVHRAGSITIKKMFGEYALYCDTKVVAFVCDNQLFVKPTDAGRTFIGEVNEAPAYPGSKMYFLITDQLEDQQWVTTLIRITADALPLPAPKKPKAPKQTKPRKSKA